MKRSERAVTRPENPVRRTLRDWLLDELDAAVQIVLCGCIGAALVGVIAGEPWTLTLLIPAAVIYRLQNPPE